MRRQSSGGISSEQGREIAMIVGGSRILLRASLICAVGLTGPQPSSGEPLVRWPQFHGRPSHQGVNPAESVVGVGNVFNLSLQWIGTGDFSQFGVVFKSSPAIVGAVAYFGDTDGNLYAFPANGCGNSQCQPLLRAPLGQGSLNSPAVVDGLVDVGTSSNLGALYAFDAAGCGGPVCNTPEWKSTPLSVVEGSPTVANGVVYVGSSKGVYAFGAHGCGGPVCSPLWIG